MASDAIANVLFRISAYADQEGLPELGRRVTDAATAALREVPGASYDHRLISLARADMLNLRRRLLA